MTAHAVSSSSFGFPGVPREGHVDPGSDRSAVETSRHHYQSPGAADEPRGTSAVRSRQHRASHPDKADRYEPEQKPPLLLGYLCAPLLTTHGELLRTKERLTDFAEREGFALGDVFIEERTTTPAAFEALIEAASRHEVTAVVVPSMVHLTVLGAPTTLKNRFERLTGTRLLVAAADRPDTGRRASAVADPV